MDDLLAGFSFAQASLWMVPQAAWAPWRRCALEEHLCLTLGKSLLLNKLIASFFPRGMYVRRWSWTLWLPPRLVWWLRLGTCQCSRASLFAARDASRWELSPDIEWISFSVDSGPHWIWPQGHTVVSSLTLIMEVIKRNTNNKYNNLDNWETFLDQMPF